MEGSYLNDLYFGWGWLLWLGIMILLFSSVGNWGYTYRVHRNYGKSFDKNAVDILNEHYASGEIRHEEYSKMKADIST